MLQRLSTGHVVWHLEDGSSGALSPKLIGWLADWAQRNPDSTEAGGLLLGFIDIDTQGLLVESLTVPGKGDKRSRASFYRGSKHQVEAEKWHNANYGHGTQLGLWHTHPEPNPSPSGIDLEDCRTVLAKGKFAAGGLVYIIVGTRTIGCWFAKPNLPLILLGHFKP